MGQKTNPIILRLGINKTWKIKHAKKTNEEFKQYTFKSLELAEFLSQALKKKSIYLQNYNINCKPNLVVLNVSCFLYTRQPLPKNYSDHEYLFVRFKGIAVPVDINTKHFLKRNDGFVIKLAQTVKKYFKNSPKVVINFALSNKEVGLNKKKLNSIKLGVSSLRKFSRAPFFKKGIEVIASAVGSSNFCKVLAEFVAEFLKKIKTKQNFFLLFLKKALNEFLKPKSLSAKKRGIMIRVKGRINGADRARHRNIKAGSLSTHTLKTRVEYFETHTTNANGSYGVKVWASEKEN